MFIYSIVLESFGLGLTSSLATEKKLSDIILNNIKLKKANLILSLKKLI